jgi:aspartate/methionine/tyrosine aminotransferase
MNNPDLNFGWGDTDGIREIMLDRYSKDVPSHPKTGTDIFNLDQGYPAHEGNPELILLVKDLIKKLTKKEYKHVLITNGATNGICATLSALSPEEIYINDRYFSFYPGITKQFAKKVFSVSFKKDIISHHPDAVAVIDSPSNPRGDLIIDLETASDTKIDTVWDAAYWSPAYVPSLQNMPMPEHRVMVGSLSKLTGINGIRLGWIATDEDAVYEKCLDYITHNLCGVSGLSQDLAISILKYVDLDRFFSDSASLLADNKSEFSRVSSLFGNQKIPDLGMFIYWNVDPALLQKVKNAGIIFTSGSFIGGKENEIRINLSRKKHLTKNLVDLLLKL